MGRSRKAILGAATGVLLAMLLAASSASANTVLRVDAVHGHDTGNCLSAPCKTIGYAIGQGRMIPDLITIKAAPGTYTEDLSLGASDSGLSIIGAGGGTRPAKNTIIKGVSGNPTVNTTATGDAASLSLASLRIVTPAGDTSPSVVGSSANLKLNEVPVVAQGGGPGLVDSNAVVTLSKSPITVGTTTGSGYAIQGGSLSLSLIGSPIVVNDTGFAISNGSAPLTLTNSPITLTNTSGSGYAISNSSGAITLTNSAITVKSTGFGISGGSAPLTLANSPITLTNTSGSGFAIANAGGAITLTGSPIDVKSTGFGISGAGAPLTLKSSPITLENTGGSGFGIANAGGSIALTSSAITVKSTGFGVDGGSAPVTLSHSPVNLENDSGTGFGLADNGAAVTVANSPITVRGSGFGISGGGASLTLTSSPVKLLTPSNTSFAVANSAGSVTVNQSPVVVKGSGGGILFGSSVLTVINSPISLTGTTGTTPAIAGSGAKVTLEKSNLDVKDQSIGIVNSNGPIILSSLHVTLDNPANSNPALVVNGRGSVLSHVSVSGAWSGSAMIESGSATIADSTLSSRPMATAPLLSLADGGTGLGRAILIERSRLTEHSSTVPAISATNTDLAIVSSAVLGGDHGVEFEANNGATRNLTVASSTVDAGALGSRDASPINSVLATTDNTAGSLALANVEGSILVEPPAAERGGTNGSSQLNCSHTEVPSTNQAASSTQGAILCGSGSRGNTSTASLAAIFARPASKTYKLNPHWSGVDSVPASAISIPAPFSDSPTDLLGHPRALNGRGTCLPGVRDKGAIELTGHGGVVPKPVISGPSHATKGAAVRFTGKAPNLPASVHPKFKWHTSDGASGTGRHFSHRFQRVGQFTVSLKVTGGAACTAGTSKKVTISAPAKHKHSARKAQRKAVHGAGRGGSPHRRGTGRPNGAPASFRRATTES